MANEAKQELWRERIKSFQASGLSRKEWCQKHEYYNERSRHGSLGYKAPSQFHEAFLRNNGKGIAIVS